MKQPYFLASTIVLLISTAAHTQISLPPAQSDGTQSQSAKVRPFARNIVATRAVGHIGGWLSRHQQNQQTNPSVRQGSGQPLTDVEQRLGPFALAAGQDFFVVVHSKRLQIAPGKFDDAAAWLEIRDASGAVEDREDFAYTVENGSFNDQCSVGAEMVAGNNGKGILISALCLPSAPMSGGPWQIFTLRDGKLVALGKPLYAEGDIEGFVPGPIKKQGTLTVISPDTLNLKLFTGNVFVIVPFILNWMQGKLEPAIHCYGQSGRGPVETGCEVQVVDVQRVPMQQEMTFVRMFSESNEQMTPAHVVIRKNSNVEIVAAKVRASMEETKESVSLRVDDDVWLKVRVDGKEGWIHTQEDFEAVGLPQSG